MNRQVLSALVLVLAGLAAGAWLLRDPAGTGPGRPAAERTIDYFLERVTVTEMGAQGEPARTLHADVMRHIAETGHVELEQPRFTLYDEATPVWQLRAEAGLSEAGGEQITLTGDVHVVRTGDNPLTIVTDYLVVHPDAERAETDAAVTLTSPAARVDAVGMDILMAEETIILRSEVRGIYEP